MGRSEEVSEITKEDRVGTTKDGTGRGPRSRRTKQILLWLAAVRLVLALVALPLAAFLYPTHFLVLVLLRPSLGVLLAGSILARQGHISLLEMIACAIPLQLAAVWVYFLLGDAWQSEIESDDRLPFVTARLLQRSQIRRLRKLLRSHGMRLVVLARFAIFPVGLLATTAGASDLQPQRFFLADGAGLVGAVGLVVGTGYGLGIGTHEAGPWLVAIGVSGLVGISAYLTWKLWSNRNSSDIASK